MGLLFRNAGDVISRLRRKQGYTDTELARKSDMYVDTLRDIESGTPPSEKQLNKLADPLDVEPEALKLPTGDFPEEIEEQIASNPERALNALQREFKSEQGINQKETSLPEPFYTTDKGRLYQGDCRDILPELEKRSFDLIFADPPFNLGKDYGENSDDDIPEDKYLDWCTEWIDECIPLLKDGGAFFIYNLPSWNIHLARYLSRELKFKDWITIDIKFRLPIPNQLYPSHYSLLYFIKGDKAKTFDPDRLPIETCRHCGGEQKDYGGYKSKMNPEGVSLTDVWDDIPPVRHSKTLVRDANQLSVKLLHRVISMSSEEGDRVLDPFGGAGTTYAAAEIMEREWIGIELHDCSPIEKRLNDLSTDKDKIREAEKNQNVLFTEKALMLRQKYKEEFGFNFDDYDLSKSTTPQTQKEIRSYQE